MIAQEKRYEPGEPYLFFKSVYISLVKFLVMKSYPDGLKR